MKPIIVRGELAYNMPRIKSVAIRNIKVFKKLDIRFSPGLNIVSSSGPDAGKTTLLSLLASAVQHGFMLWDEHVRHGTRRGSLRVDYAPFAHTAGVGADLWCYGLLMLNDFSQLKKFVRTIRKEDCFLLELDWLTSKVPCGKILDELSKAKCQVIATVLKESLLGVALPRGARHVKL